MESAEMSRAADLSQLKMGDRVTFSTSGRDRLRESTNVFDNFFVIVQADLQRLDLNSTLLIVKATDLSRCQKTIPSPSL